MALPALPGGNNGTEFPEGMEALPVGLPMLMPSGAPLRPPAGLNELCKRSVGGGVKTSCPGINGGMAVAVAACGWTRNWDCGAGHFQTC